MELTHILIGIIGFAALCALVAVLGLRLTVHDLRETVDRNYGHFDKFEDKTNERYWQVHNALIALGMRLEPPADATRKWVRDDKKGGAE